MQLYYLGLPEKIDFCKKLLFVKAIGQSQWALFQWRNLKTVDEMSK